MFQDLLIDLKRNIDTIRSVIKTSNSLRALFFTSDYTTKPEWKEVTKLLSSQLITDIPDRIEWEVYDHSQKRK